MSTCKDEVLGYLWSIASSAIKADLEKNTLAFKSSEEWKNSPTLQKYYSEHWEIHKEVHYDVLRI